MLPKKKDILKGVHFVDTGDVRSNTTAALKAIPQNQFQIVFKGGLGAGNRDVADKEALNEPTRCTPALVVFECFVSFPVA
jgi:hypothetical protein